MDPVGEVWADIPMCNLGAPRYGRNDPESCIANSGWDKVCVIGSLVYRAAGHG